MNLHRWLDENMKAYSMIDPLLMSHDLIKTWLGFIFGFIFDLFLVLLDKAQLYTLLVLNLDTSESKIHFQKAVFLCFILGRILIAPVYFFTFIFAKHMYSGQFSVKSWPSFCYLASYARIWKGLKMPNNLLGFGWCAVFAYATEWELFRKPICFLSFFSLDDIP